jgi:hypothetical protein
VKKPTKFQRCRELKLLVSEGTKVETKDDDYEVAEDADEESTRKSEKALMLIPLILARERDRRKRIMNGF